jgi:hypothetical protein
MLVLAAPATLLLSQGQAKAILTDRIFDEGPNLKLTVGGSISELPATSNPGSCGPSGFLSGQFNTFFPSLLCSGIDTESPIYSISGPDGYGGNGFLSGADLAEGFSFMLIPSTYIGSTYYQSTTQLDAAYVLGQPFFSSATFNGKSLASEGFTATGLVGTWTIDGTSESINVCIGSDPCGVPPAQVPGPVPLLGAGAAFGWSRRLRRRISSPLGTPPVA